MNDLERKWLSVIEQEAIYSRYHNFRERLIKKSVELNCDPQSVLDRMSFERYDELLNENNEISFSYTILPNHFTKNQFHGIDKCDEIKTVTFKLSL